MSTELTRYYENLLFSRSTLGTVGTGLDLSKVYLTALNTALGQVRKAIDSFETMDDLADNLASAINIIKFFPPLKTIGKLVDRALDSLRDGSGTFLERMEDIEKALDDYEQGIKEAKFRIKEIDRGLGQLEDEISSVIPGLDALRTVLDADLTDVPPSYAAIVADLDAKLAPMNDTFELLPQAQLTAINDKVEAFKDLIADFADFGEVFAAIARVFDSLFDRLRFLDGPLDTIVGALDGFFWLLEKAERVISFVLDPILDPIIEASGIDDLIDRLLSGVTGLLPDYDTELLEFANFAADLQSIFGNLPSGGLDWEIPLVAEIRTLADDILGAFNDAAGYLGQLKAAGSVDTDLMVGDSNIIAGFDLSSASNFDGLGGRDVLVGGSKGDTLDGGADDDLIVASGGDDTIDGGAGTGDIFASVATFSDYSWYFEETSPDDFTFFFTYLGPDAGLQGRSEVTNVEYFIFDGATFEADALKDIIKGTDGVINQLEGTAGNDLIFGGNGVDVAMPDMVGLNLGLGSSEYLIASGVTMPTTALTVEFLIKGELPADGESPALMSYGVPGSTNEFTFFVTQTGNPATQQLRIIINNEIIDTGIDASAFLDGDIHRLSVRWESDGVRGNGYVHVLIDGSFVDSFVGLTAGASDPITSGGVMVFGQDQDGVTPGDTGSFEPIQAFEGYIGDIRVFEGYRSGNAVEQNAFFEISDPSSEPDLVQYWTFDAQTETTTSLQGPALSVVGPGSNDWLDDPVQRVFLDLPELGDTINGYGGDDRITGFSGQDLIDGGDGVDTVDYSAEGTDSEKYIFLDPTHPARTDPDHRFYSQLSDLIFNVENAVGSGGHDTIGGDEGDNRLNGRAGEDNIFGFGGNDIILGGAGRDYALVGGEGDDIVMGGEGSDYYMAGPGEDAYFDTDAEGYNVIFYAADGQGFVENQLLSFDAASLLLFPDMVEVRTLADGRYVVDKHYGDAVFQDTLEGVFQLFLSDSNDTIFSNNLTYAVDGQLGDDLFIGQLPVLGQEPDEIRGPRLIGGQGNDTLISYTGDENFQGGTGDDLVELRIISTEDYAPDDETGPRERLLTGDWGFDTIDLRNSDLNWVFDVDANQSLAGWDNNFLISTVDISAGEATNFTDAEVFTARDRFQFDGFERFLGSEQVETFTIGTPNAISRLDADFWLETNGGDDYVWAFRLDGDLYADMGDGDDQVTSGFGVDTVFGGDGNDQIFAWGNDTGGLELFDGGAGNDSIVVQQPISANVEYEFIGGDGRDLLDFSGLGWILEVDIAAQTYSLNDGRITGDFSGFEALIGGTSGNTIIGDDEDNILSGARGADVIYGGSGDDVLYGATTVGYFSEGNPGPISNDVIDGGDGNDLIHLSQGRNTVRGGDGTDTLRLAGQLQYSPTQGFVTVYPGTIVRSDWTVNLGTGFGSQISYGDLAGDGTVTGDVTFSDIEVVIGGLGNDVLIAAAAGMDLSDPLKGSVIDGSDGDDQLIGLDGVDNLAGGRGNDLIIGNGAADELSPGAGFDFVSGGEGIDTLDLRQGTTGITKTTLLNTVTYEVNDLFPIREGESPGLIASSAGFSGIEIINLSDKVDFWLGSATSETVRGNDGDDVIQGGGGGDRLEGGAGNDHLIGDGGPVESLPDMIYLNQAGQRNDYLQASGVVMPTTALTIEFMINGTLDLPNQTGALMSYGVTGATNELLLLYKTAAAGRTLDLWVNNQLFDTGVDASLFLDGLDHRFSFTRDGGDMQIFVDGGLVWSDSLSDAFATPLTSGGTLVFGQDQDGSTPGVPSTYADDQALIAGLGDIRVFDTVRTGTEIAANAGTALSDPGSEPNLVNYWTVDAGTEALATQVGANLSVVGANTFVDGATGGQDGRNELNGGAGDDTLEAGDQGDILFDGFGNNTLLGGAGDDLLYVLSGTNTLDGGGGADILMSGQGSDSLIGGQGNDILVGDLGAVLYGNDTLEGGLDDDILMGGSGADTFIFAPGDGADIIGAVMIDYDDPANSTLTGRDFEVGQDVIALMGFGYGPETDITTLISDIGGNAVFDDQGTSITFFGLSAADLTADNFLFA